MNKMQERAKALLCMEYLVRQINNEDILEGWLMCGIADGEIDYGCLDVSAIYEDSYYMDEKNFAYMMKLFLKLMCKAYKDGGLYCSGVVSEKPQP